MISGGAGLLLPGLVWMGLCYLFMQGGEKFVNMPEVNLKLCKGYGVPK
jgi:hypothetical protein